MGTNTSEQKAKFYDGPTVSAAEKEKARRKASPSTSSAKQGDKKSQDSNKSRDAASSVPVKRTTNIPEGQLQVAKVKRKKRGGLTLCGLISLLPLLIFASLFSTILCPPSTSKPSTFSSIALGTLGLKTKPAESSLHKTLCYPANVYHDEVLVPYVYPAIEDAKDKATSTPFYQDKVEPAYKKAKAVALKAWDGTVKPVVDRTCRGARIVYRKYIAPHAPYVKAKFTEATAPLRIRLKALYKTHIGPHVRVAKKRACSAMKRVKAKYNQVAGNPMTKRVGRQAHSAFIFSRNQGGRAYAYSRPHAIRAYNVGKRHARETVIPRSVQALKYAGKQVCNTWTHIKVEWAKFYKKNLAEHCDPYLAKASETLKPICEKLYQQVYVPYIQPLVRSVFPPQEKPRTFWSLVSDFVPATGSITGKRSGQTASTGQQGKKATHDVKQTVADAEQKAAKAKRAAEEKVAAAKRAAEDKAAAAKKAAEQKAAAAKKVAEDKAVAAKKAAEDRAAASAKKAAEEKEAALQKKKAEEAAAEEAVIEAEIAANAKAAFKKAEASRAAASDPDDLTRRAFVVPTDDVTVGGTATAAPTSLSGTVTGSAACDSTTGSNAAKDHVADARAEIQQLNRKVEFQGKALYAKVQTEAVKQAEHFLGLLSEMKAIGDENLEREIGRMMGGLDRLYSNSRTLTRHQVEESQRMSDGKVLKILEQVTNGVKTKKNHIYEKTQPAVENAQAEMDRVLGDDYAALGKRMGTVEGITAKDWTAYKALKKDVADWKTKLAEAPEKNHSKQLKNVIQKAQAGAAELLTDFSDSYAGWKTRQEALRKQALDGIAAREALEAETKEVKRATQATIVAPKEKKVKASPHAKVDKQAEGLASAKDEL